MRYQATITTFLKEKYEVALLASPSYVSMMLLYACLVVASVVFLFGQFDERSPPMLPPSV
jgi:hypothetical protein